MRRFLIVALALAGLTYVGTAVAGDPATSTSVNTSFSQTSTATNPCNGDSGTVVLNGMEVAHLTDLGGGVFFVTTIDVGALSFTDSSTGQVLSGPFSFTFTFESTPPGLHDLTNLFNTVATASDGTKVQYQLRAHRTRTTQGDYVVSFMIVSATCISTG